MGDHPKPLEAELRAEAEAVERASLPDAEQMELIRDLVPGRDPATAVEAFRRGPRRPGRPQGARNRQNKKFRDYILHQHGHPGDVLGRTWNRPVELLAAELKCSLHEAKLLQIRAAAELLPYIEGKQPIQIDLKAHHDAVLVIGGPPGVDGGQLEALRDEINEAGEAVDWGEAEFEDVPLLGEPQRDAPPTDDA